MQNTYVIINDKKVHMYVILSFFFFCLQSKFVSLETSPHSLDWKILTSKQGHNCFELVIFKPTPNAIL